MNVDQIYQLQRDDAFAEQFSSDTYTTFVAMPFSNRGGYPESRIRSLLLEKVHDRANDLLPDDGNGRRFAPLKRVDGGPGGAITITDQIAADILNCHFFVGDLTGCNFGVVIETGIALALKPNKRVILFTQDDTASLHFDLKVTNVNRYNEDNLVEKAATALVTAAKCFEEEADRYIRLVSSQLTPEAILLLNFYGRLWKNWIQGDSQPSIYREKVIGTYNEFMGEGGRVAFHQALRELLERRLFWTHYTSESARSIDSYGLHATKLGWSVIEKLWEHDPEMRGKPGMPTGPNQISQS
ncbi:hypothetical protein [Pelagicoccus sp. SDUM812005]|uniref:hypothetical protein n=1 Tax=Pelagicoccus sp. SDUM812005 TaxID=3041257 RepID=UPI00281061D5|nr:hypothetical protein [Pelagicoccus sp. SDUM812005]MDQ8180359.1 hypothetical protein [Pelagicoccus sp. SDUM812005]